MLRKFKRRKAYIWLIVLGLMGLCSVLPLRIAIARHQAPTPQAILVLEGETERIRFAAKFSTAHSPMPIWVSGNPEGYELNQSIFRTAGVPVTQVHYDFCATDTVTNFTCNVAAFTSHHIQHVYVMTSDYHMTRSLAIATLVFGSHGIAVTPVEVASSGHAPESWLRTVRDCLRSLLWLLTGKSGASLRHLACALKRDGGMLCTPPSHLAFYEAAPT